ncbi:hypothetical protein B0T11DRAFT_61728 [Plectosphaerella cucumerina]|uniref:Secreted protein n=1 Tax=Plectosphaerella cucumerina TaxID=40658 RepID=A0A8K0TKT0_9PEZI|nr:hypothetical protein B0T11DRAFT_61728 [Plectosphaerella cucumerina]
MLVLVVMRLAAASTHAHAAHPPAAAHHAATTRSLAYVVVQVAEDCCLPSHAAATHAATAHTATAHAHAATAVVVVNLLDGARSAHHATAHAGRGSSGAAEAHCNGFVGVFEVYWFESDDPSLMCDLGIVDCLVIGLGVVERWLFVMMSLEESMH